jgi:hypothetical protein
VSEQGDPRNLISQKGWIQVDFNKAIWVPCPPGFAPGADREKWAAGYARACWVASGLKHGKRQISALAQSFSHIHQSAYSTLPCHLALIHVRDPRAVPLLVCFGVWPAESDRQAQIRSLAGADEDGAMEPPIVTEFPTEKLGDGLKVMSYFRDQGTVTASLSYAWRSEEFETAVRLFTACPDLGRLQGALDDLDDLARAITVIPRSA